MVQKIGRGGNEGGEGKEEKEEEEEEEKEEDEEEDEEDEEEDKEDEEDKQEEEETLSKLRLKLNQNKAKSTKHAGRPADSVYINCSALELYVTQCNSRFRASRWTPEDLPSADVLSPPGKNHIFCFSLSISGPGL